MKKFFALLVTLAMTVSLAACTSDTETSQSDPPSDTTQGAQGSSNAEISTEAKQESLKLESASMPHPISIIKMYMRP